MRFSSSSASECSYSHILAMRGAVLSACVFASLFSVGEAFAQGVAPAAPTAQAAPAKKVAAPGPGSASGSATATAAAPTPLSADAIIDPDDTTIPGVYKDMVVVQRKAKEKAHKWLLSPYFTLDFSDGPITNYAFNTDIGYAFSDSWEAYINIVPFFVTVERPIVSKVRALTLANGQQASITYAKPTYQLGGEVLWLPAYGKESWGAHSIVRSDTFLKAALNQTFFQSGDTGLRFAGAIGKTYYVKSQFNIRVDAGVSYAQTVVDSNKTGTWAPLLEAGLVFYF